MDEDLEKVTVVREQIRRGAYQVEPKAVADAILRRLRDIAEARREHVAPTERARGRERTFQMECS